MNLELVKIFQYPEKNLCIKLLQNLENGEGIVIGHEIAKLMGYYSTGNFLRNSHCQENIHFYLLQGNHFRRLKNHLQQNGIYEYTRCNRLLLISETGIGFLLGRHCKEEAIRVGGWLLTCVFPHLYPSKNFCYQILHSDYFDKDICLLFHRGRFAFFASQIFSFLNEKSLDYISYGIQGYIENIHLKPLEPQYNSFEKLLSEKDKKIQTTFNYIFYESGLYRYLQHCKNPLVPILKLAFIKELQPKFRKPPQKWSSLPYKSNITKAKEPIHLYTTERNRKEPSYVNIHKDLEDIKIQLSMFTKKTQKILENYQAKVNHLEETQKKIFDHLEFEPKQTKTKNDFEEPKFSKIKELAISLGIYYMDQKTPHLIFAKTLSEYISSASLLDLKRAIEDLNIVKGKNVVEITRKTFRIWKR